MKLSHLLGKNLLFDGAWTSLNILNILRCILPTPHWIHFFLAAQMSNCSNQSFQHLFQIFWISAGGLCIHIHGFDKQRPVLQSMHLLYHRQSCHRLLHELLGYSDHFTRSSHDCCGFIICTCFVEQALVLHMYWSYVHTVKWHPNKMFNSPLTF